MTKTRHMASYNQATTYLCFLKNLEVNKKWRLMQKKKKIERPHYEIFEKFKLNPKGSDLHDSACLLVKKEYFLV